MKKNVRLLPVVACVLMLSVASSSAWAADTGTYRVSVTNLSGQILSPPIVVSHSWRTFLFRAGVAASPGVRGVAEDAVPDTLMDELAADPFVFDVAMAGGVIMPGATRSVEIDLANPFNRLSFIAMLVTTNDAMAGLDNHRIEDGVRVRRLLVPAYDAGTEANNELCDFIPGPPCGSPLVRDTDGAEGVVLVHRGIQGVGDLVGDAHDWRNPVARVTVTKLP